ncbi:Thi4 domain protein, partial [Leptospira interrogans str. 2006001854]
MIYDVVIVGSGPGGSTLSYGLMNSGLKILILEKGNCIPREIENWDSESSTKFSKKYSHFITVNGIESNCRAYFNVGGQSKFYGSSLLRLREKDFNKLQHIGGGISPKWPISYEELEPYYAKAEIIYKVHGLDGEDPTGPYRSTGFPYPPISHDFFQFRIVITFV